MFKYVIAAHLLVAAFSSQAQVEIVDSKPISGKGFKPVNEANTNSPSQQANMAASNTNAELYYQLQVLQQEVLELRGMVEQQTYEIKQLKKQRLDDYVDLDRRISQLYLNNGEAGASTAPSPASNTASPTATVGSNFDSGPSLSPADELASYKAAIDLVIKKRDFDGGSSALQSYLQDFPKGTYVANAFYWLGQIYLQKGDTQASRSWFEKMVERFPNHSKVPEAKYKLGKLLFDMGETNQAQKYLRDVAQSGSSAASLAQEFLNQNF